MKWLTYKNSKEFMIRQIALIAMLYFSFNVFSMEKDNSTLLSDKIYYDGSYESDHWAMQPLLLDNTRVIALATYSHLNYAVILIPTDKRGYRCIVILIDNDDMSTVINREYTLEEQVGLMLISQLIMNVFREIVPIVQMAIAGNNSHTFNKETGIVGIGKPEEPSMLHAHIFGRGNPEKQYINEVALEGPIPGPIFDMMGKTPNSPGNETKIPWQKETMEKVAKKLKIGIEKIKNQYGNLGIEIITSVNTNESNL